MARKAMINKQQRPQKFKSREYTRCSICGRPHAVREYTRCSICGRPHAVLKKYGICRICFRNLASKGEIPGVKKASW